MRMLIFYAYACFFLWRRLSATNSSTAAHSASSAGETRNFFIRAPPFDIPDEYGIIIKNTRSCANVQIQYSIFFRRCTIQTRRKWR